MPDPLVPVEPTIGCHQCLYPLDGLDTGRCPECGCEFDLTDSTTFISLSAIRLTLLQHALRALAIAVVLLVLATPVLYARDGTGWTGGATYDVTAERVSLGVPLPWLTYVKITSSGSPPASVPWAPYLPGMHFSPLWLAASFAIALVVGILLHLALWSHQRRPTIARLRCAWPSWLAIWVLAALAWPCMYLFEPTRGPMIFLAVPIVVAIVTWKNCSYLFLAIGCLVGAVGMWYGFRITDHFDVPHRIHDISSKDAGMIVFQFLLYITPLLIILLVRRALSRSKAPRST